MPEREITWRDFDRLEHKVDRIAETMGTFATNASVEKIDDRIDRVVLSVLAIFGALTVLGASTAVALLSTGAG